LPSLTVENYVKAIFNIAGGSPERPAATGQVAVALGVSPGTVTSMLKTLSENGLANYTPYEGVRLTPSGNSLALKIIRRHRLIEAFLAQSLGLRWDEIHNDAEQMEHVVTDFLIDRIDEHLGRPVFDPHGDPIPTAEGKMEAPATQPLSQCPEGYRFRLSRVVDQTPEFLRFLTRSGLALGTVGQVAENHPEAGTVTLAVDSRRTTFGYEAASNLLVSPVE
jgi:DtxR family transcriptional regulator, Mn-dependent transcriptional regulator